jgi:hypothetical protein
MPKKVEENPKTVDAVKNLQPWSYVTVGVFGTVVVLATIIMGLHVFAVHRPDHEAMGMKQFVLQERGERMFGHSRAHVAKHDVVQGVITQVEGDTLTVSGNGTQVTVKRSASTVVGGDKADVAVNDTVLVVGDKASDGSVSAAKIVVMNRELNRAPGFQSSEDTMQPGA